MSHVHGSEELDLHVQNMNNVLRRAMDYDDRGMVVTVGAYLETSLRKLLDRRLIDAPVSQRIARSFSDRIKLARSVGCIDANQYDDLEIIRDVRNRAAHSWEDFNFEQAANASAAERLGPRRSTFHAMDGARGTFFNRAADLLIWLEILSFWIDRPMADGTVIFKRIEEIQFELKAVPVERG